VVAEDVAEQARLGGLFLFPDRLDLGVETRATTKR
jgi:hypothetical protein